MCVSVVSGELLQLYIASYWCVMYSGPALWLWKMILSQCWLEPHITATASPHDSCV